MSFYNKLDPEQQEQATDHMGDLLCNYLSPGITQARISDALEELNPYISIGRAIAFSHEDQIRVLDWLQKKHG